MLGKHLPLPLFLVLIWALSAISAFATCSTNSAISTVQVKICAPGSGATVPSTFHFSAADSSANGILASQIYIDGIKYGDYFVPDVELNITLAGGSHRLTFQAIDKKSLKIATSETINIGSTTPRQVDLSWRPSTTVGVDSYIVYRSLRSGGGYSEAGTSATINFVDKPGTGTFYYVVTAVSPRGESAYSREIKVIVQ